MAPTKGRKLDFMVLNHDEDLISTVAREYLLTPATRVNAVTIALTTGEKANGEAPAGKPDFILMPRDVQTHATVK